MNKKVKKKPASKKAIAMNIIKHKRVVLESVGTESLPDMVFVSAAPAWAKAIVGKRYVSLDKAKTIIETLDAEKIISKGAKNLLKEMDAAGIVPLDVDSI
jgi:hypothetical protein